MDLTKHNMQQALSCEVGYSMAVVTSITLNIENAIARNRSKDIQKHKQ